MAANPARPDARRAVVSALSRLEQEQGYSNIVLDNLLKCILLTLTMIL